MKLESLLRMWVLKTVAHLNRCPHPTTGIAVHRYVRDNFIVGKSWWTRLNWYHGRQYVVLEELIALHLLAKSELVGGPERDYRPTHEYSLTHAGGKVMQLELGSE